ncbi:rod shape-determining protein MreC [Candidatus Gottesmanbacteria bacterium]|nr:rod shape-determining protein MreC [Candidatus Gottesmanbacteria bacterium]
MESSPKLITRFAILIILSLTLIGLDTLHFLAIPKKAVLTLSTPIEFGLYSFYQNTREKFGFLGFWQKGYQELAFLKQRNLELLTETELVQKLKEENEILRNQFATTSGLEANSLVPARVVGYSRFLFLDKGQKQDVKVGSVVILNNILVGRVVSVEGNLAKVILPIDLESKIAVITSKNRAKGILKGAFGSLLTLDEILQSEKVESEETLETYGGEYFPNGILVAKIKKITGDPSATFQKAQAVALLEYDKLTMVFVKVK